MTGGPFRDLLGSFGGLRPANREALATARPWAWRRVLDGLPDAPCPEAVTRPGQPFTLRMPGGDFLHSPLDPVGEAEALVRASRLEQAAAALVLGFGGGYVVEQVRYPALDGTRIPMFLIRAADLEPGPDTPCILTGYGGFSITMGPAYSAAIVDGFTEANRQVPAQLYTVCQSW